MMFTVVQLPACCRRALVFQILPTSGMMMSLPVVAKLALFDKVQSKVSIVHIFQDIAHFLYYDITGGHIVFCISFL